MENMNYAMEYFTAQDIAWAVLRDIECALAEAYTLGEITDTNYEDRINYAILSYEKTIRDLRWQCLGY